VRIFTCARNCARTIGGALRIALWLLRITGASRELTFVKLRWQARGVKPASTTDRNSLGLLALMLPERSKNMPNEDPRETPGDDPRQQTDWPTNKQTDKPWKGNPEKDQLPPDRPPIDLENWQESNTH
jgi:hypothetical protein